MASPQLENGFTRIANELFPALVSRDFSGCELRAIIAVLRLTYGFHKLQAHVSSTALSKVMGVSERYARRVLFSLVNKGVIQVVKPAKGPRAPLIQFVKDYDRWKQQAEADPGLWDAFEEGSRDPGLSGPPSLEKGGLSCPATRAPETRAPGPLRPPYAPVETVEKARPEEPAACGQKTPKERKESKDKDPLTPRQTRANPRALGTNPRAQAADPGAGAPGPPGKGLKKTKTERTEFVSMLLRDIYTFHGNVTEATEESHARQLAEQVELDGEEQVAVAVLEAIRAVTFKRFNEASVGCPSGVVVWLVCGRNKKPGEISQAAKTHRRNELARLRRSSENGLTKRPDPYRWAPKPELNWAVPPRIKQDFWLKQTPLGIYVDHHRPAWDAELARHAGLPEGGAGPGPELGRIGRDLNDLEGPTT